MRINWETMITILVAIVGATLINRLFIIPRTPLNNVSNDSLVIADPKTFDEWFKLHYPNAETV